MILYKEALKKILGHLSDNLLCCTIWLERKKTRKKLLYVCYIDFTKAFDYLNRDALNLKLQQRNVDGKFLNTIKSMFLKSSSRVKWNCKISKPIKTRYGVMQGGVLSPKLFNEFLQDHGNYLNPKYGLKIGYIYLAYLLFADDIVLFSEFAEKYKYLGIWCSNDKNILNFVKKHSYLAEQARKAIFTIRNHSHNLGHLTPKLSLKVFQAQIEPILMYGIEVLFIGKEISVTVYLFMGIQEGVLSFQNNKFWL